MMNFTMIRHDSMLMRFQRVYGKITLIKDYEFSNNCVSEPIISSFFIEFFGFFFSYVDIDECKNNSLNQCEQECVNNPGSYSCKCKSGFKLNSNGFACDGKLSGD